MKFSYTELFKCIIISLNWMEGVGPDLSNFRDENNCLEYKVKKLTYLKTDSDWLSGFPQKEVKKFEATIFFQFSYYYIWIQTLNS